VQLAETIIGSGQVLGEGIWYLGGVKQLTAGNLSKYVEVRVETKLETG
jgi:hypothetical protein